MKTSTSYVLFPVSEKGLVNKKIWGKKPTNSVFVSVENIFNSECLVRAKNGHSRKITCWSQKI